MLAPVVSTVGYGVVATWATRAAAALAVAGPIALVAVLLGHGGYDLWLVATAEPGERLPDAPAGYARAAWRALETAAALSYVLLAVVSVLFVAALPETEAGSTFFVAASFAVLFATAALVGLVAARLVVTLAYRGAGTLDAG